VKYKKGDWLLFGSETEGFPDAVIHECKEDKHGGGLVRIPIDETYVRCLNLSTAAGIGIYEALRQLGCTEDMMQRPGQRSVVIEREDIYA
jgi:tRNA (cytidine/uridine-2'-O-)-methyltransferase